MKDYAADLAGLTDWDEYLRRESGLPGPRGNLELAAVVARLGPDSLLARYRQISAESAPTNDPGEFLAFCGVLGLSRDLAAGRDTAIAELRPFAADPRWRIREATAMALQAWGDVDLPAMLRTAQAWSTGSRFEQRAAVAGLCEPRLLADPGPAEAVLQVLDEVTGSLIQAPDRKTEGFIALRKALGYGWSVAAVALPAVGLPLLEKWLTCPDQDVRWVLRENLKKNRLLCLDPEWVQRMNAGMAQA